MTRREIFKFVESAWSAVKPSSPFGRGRISEWNSKLSNEYPGGWMETYGADADLSPTLTPIDSWALRIHIGQLDKAGSSPEQYECIIDECDEIAQKMVYQMNNAIKGYKLATISGINRTPFIHRNADNVTGVILTLTITDPATTARC